MRFNPKVGISIGFGGVSALGPRALFAASEPGFFYDPSDLSTLFQDKAGTTPVTAAGQSVGLMLDKSRGLVLGPELVTNGGFDTDTAWTVSAQCSISGGVANIVSTDGSFQSISQSVTLTGGSFYELQFDVVSYTSGTPRFTFTGGSVDITFATGTGRRFARFFIPTTASSTFVFTRVAGVTSYSIDNISVRELPGNHATQSTSLSRPNYQIDASGRGHLSFDGSDDFLVTPTITPGTDKAQVFAGVRKLSDAARGLLMETGAAQASSVRIESPPAITDGRYRWASYGTTEAIATTNDVFDAPITNVLTGIGDIAADTAILRVNGVQAATSASDQGTGNYLAYPIYIGRRGGTSLPFNGRIYSLICRFGPNLTADQIAQTEAWVNSKMGAY